MKSSLQRRFGRLGVSLALVAILVLGYVAFANASSPSALPAEPSNSPGYEDVLPVEPDGGIGGEVIFPVEPDGGIGN